MHVSSRSVYPSTDLTKAWILHVFYSEVVYNLALQLIMYCIISGFFSFPGFIPFFFWLLIVHR